MAVNKFIGIGNLGRDPEMRAMPNGTEVANFSIAISEKYKNKAGEMKEVTEWVNIACFGKLAEIAGQYLTKGSTVYVEGKLKTDKYEKDGIERHSTKIIADKFQMLGGKGEKQDKPKPAQSEQEFDGDIPF